MRIFNRLLRILAVAGAFLAFPLLNVAQTTIPVTGNLGDITGSPTGYAVVQLQLLNCNGGNASITGYMGIVQMTYQFTSAPNGAISGAIWPNDIINCSGTTGATEYARTIYVNDLPVGNTLCYQVLSTQGTWNLNTQQPIACTSTAPNNEDGQYQNLNVLGCFSINGSSCLASSLSPTWWQVGTGAPSLTCSATVNAGLFYTSNTLTLYQCSNALGSWAWNVEGGSSVGGTTWPTGGAGVPNYNGSSGYGTTYNGTNQIPASFLNLASYLTSAQIAALYAPLAGPTFTGKVTTAAVATGGAGFNLPPGNAPTSPVNGDCWTTSAGLYCQIAGATIGPMGSGSAGVSSINGTPGAFTFSGTGVSCSSTTCTFSVGSGMVWPTNPGYALWLSGTTWGTPAITSPSSSQVWAAAANTTNLTISGGQDASANANLGDIVVRGASQTGAGGASSAGGNTLLQGGGNAATNAASMAGDVEIVPGASTGASTPGLPGLYLQAQVFNFTGTFAQWGLVCYTTTTMTVTPCAASPAVNTVAGVAVAQPSATTIEVAGGNSLVPVSMSNSATVGGIIQTGTTAGKATDSGLMTSTPIGTAVALSGTWGPYPDGTAFPTLSATLPLVQLNLVPGLCMVTSGSTVLKMNSSGTCIAVAGITDSGSVINLTENTTMSAGKSFQNVIITAPGSAATITPQSGDTYVFPSPPSGTSITLGGNFWRPSWTYGGVPGSSQLVGAFVAPADETITMDTACTNYKAVEGVAGSTTDTYTVNLYAAGISGTPTAELTITFSSGSTTGAFTGSGCSGFTIAAGGGITITNSGTAATGTNVVITLEGTHTN
ncbi:MAG: hypothetical protein ACLQLH_03575 [Terracidiphilus sp.]